MAANAAPIGMGSSCQGSDSATAGTRTAFVAEDVQRFSFAARASSSQANAALRQRCCRRASCRPRSSPPGGFLGSVSKCPEIQLLAPYRLVVHLIVIVRIIYVIRSTIILYVIFCHQVNRCDIAARGLPRQSAV